MVVLLVVVLVMVVVVVGCVFTFYMLVSSCDFKIFFIFNWIRVDNKLVHMIPIHDISGTIPNCLS